MQATPMTDGPRSRGDTRTADKWYRDHRLGGLRRFAIAITILNVLGHTWLGFEQSWAQPLVGTAAAYSMELLLEAVECFTRRRQPRFFGGFQAFIDFFLPAHISGLACSMLLYANERLAPIAFAATVAIASKHLFQVATAHGQRHVFNPSNFGITITLLLFPWVGIAQPYQFTENLDGLGDWILPGLIIVSGTFLNWRYTKRLPLIAAWLLAFILQALVRHFAIGSEVAAALMPMTGVAFILYSFYMVTDPPTTPTSVKGQIAFGSAVGLVYGLLMASHIVFGLFFALTIVSLVRASYLFVSSTASVRANPISTHRISAPEPTYAMDASPAIATEADHDSAILAARD